MFFTPELLSRRDSGIGLLWLAATLGSKSAFTKLQKRDVMTANISQLCSLVARPAEPLALRLSSNLMVGVVRVYKVKQEIFMSDVTVCFNALKKVVDELRSSGSLQMAQPTARPSAVTLADDLRTAFAMEFDNMIADWDEYLNVGETRAPKGIDDDFDPNAKPNPTKRKKNRSSLNAPEQARADLHTLQENHEHLFSSSFEASFHGSGGVGLSSSQPEAAFDLADDFLEGLDGFDIGADLAKELGPGWGASPVKFIQDKAMDLHLSPEIRPVELGIDMDVDVEIGAAGDGHNDYGFENALEDLPVDVPTEQLDVAVPYSPIPLQSPQPEQDNIHSPFEPRSAKTSRAESESNFIRSFLGQDTAPESQVVEQHIYVKKPAAKKPNTTKLLLDPRTELTDKELKAARAQYLELQSRLRQELGLKRSEKDNNKIMEALLWGAPEGVHAQVLMDFWLDNFKVQVEARSNAVIIHPRENAEQDGPPAKRRRIEDVAENPQSAIEAGIDDAMVGTAFEADQYDVQGNFDAGQDHGGDFFGGLNEMDVEPGSGHFRSSEEPGQGRQASRPPSVIGSNFGFHADGQEFPASGSQRSSLFPWDNAGASSSAGGAADRYGDGSDRISVERVEVQVRGRGSSMSRRQSPLAPSQAGSIPGIGFSPMAFGRMSTEDFAFEVPVDEPIPEETQQSDLNLVTLERNSFNFLEYARMQIQSRPPTSPALTFDDIVPKTTSTHRVAATAFYHCLGTFLEVLLLHLHAPRSYRCLTIGRA